MDWTTLILQMGIDFIDFLLIMYVFLRLRRKANADDVYGQEDLEALDDAVSKIEGDLA